MVAMVGHKVKSPNQGPDPINNGSHQRDLCFWKVVTGIQKDLQISMAQGFEISARDFKASFFNSCSFRQVGV